MGKIIGLSIGGVLLVALVVFLIYFFILREKFAKKELSEIDRRFQFLHALLIGQDAQYVKRLEIISRTNLLYVDIHTKFLKKFKDIRNKNDGDAQLGINSLRDFIDEKEAVVGMLAYFANDAEIIEHVRKFAIGHFCYLISRTDVAVPTLDIGKYEQMRQQMLDYIRQNRNYIYSNKNRSLKSKLGFWLMITNYNVYWVVKKVWNVVKWKKE